MSGIITPPPPPSWSKVGGRRVKDRAKSSGKFKAKRGEKNWGDEWRAKDMPKRSRNNWDDRVIGRHRNKINITTLYKTWTANGLKILFSNASITPNFLLSLRFDFSVPPSTILFFFSPHSSPTLGVLLRSLRAKRLVCVLLAGSVLIPWNELFTVVQEKKWGFLNFM